MRLTTEQHDTLAAAIGRREWVKAHAPLARETLVLEHAPKVGIDVSSVTPALLAVAMSRVPLDARDICNFAEMAYELAAAMPKAPPQSVNADLLAVAQKCEAMLTRQKWLPDGTDAEAVLLREARAAIAKAQS